MGKFKSLEKGNVKEIEERQIEAWKKEDILNKTIENRKDAKNFVFYDGPAYANGFPGVHHMLAKILKDAVCKYKTMKGFKVDRKVGWDTHGLPTEVNVEKLLGKTFTIIWLGESKYETTIDNAIKLLSILEEYAKEFSKSVETYFTKHGKMPLDLDLIDTDIDYSKHSVVCDYRAQDNTFTLSNCVIDGNKYNDVYTSKEINK